MAMPNIFVDIGNDLLHHERKLVFIFLTFGKIDFFLAKTTLKMPIPTDISNSSLWSPSADHLHLG